MRSLLVLSVLCATLVGSTGRLTVHLDSWTAHERSTSGLTFVQHQFWGKQEGVFTDYPVFVLNATELASLCELIFDYENAFTLPITTGPPDLGEFDVGAVRYFQSRMNRSIVLLDEGLMQGEVKERCFDVVHYNFEAGCLIFPGSVLISYTKRALPPWVFPKSWDNGFGFSERKARVPDQACTKLAMVFGELDSNTYDLLKSRVEKATGSVEIDPHPLGTIYDHPLTRFVFQFFFGGFCLILVFVAIAFVVVRYKKTKSKTKVQFFVLGANIIVLLTLGVTFLINGYGVVGVFYDTVNNAFRAVFFGSGVALDMALARLWDDLTFELIVTGSRNRRNMMYNLGMACCFFSDVCIFLSFFINGALSMETLAFLMKVFSAFLVLLQLVVIARLTVSTTRILNLLSQGLSVVGKSTTMHQFQKALIRRLAFWIRVSMFAASFSTITLVNMSIGFLYWSSPVVHVIFNGSLCLSRILNAMAQIMVAAPPPSALNRISPDLSSKIKNSFLKNGVRRSLHNLTTAASSTATSMK